MANFDDKVLPAGEENSGPGQSMSRKTEGDSSQVELAPAVTGKHVLTEDECYKELGFSFSEKKKWAILSIIFAVQLSMNFNTSLFANAIPGITEEFDVSAQAARAGLAVFLVFYAFGCELWAPWSEELGRWPILQLSLFLVNIWQIPVALAPNFATILIGRALGGLSSAGGSVTLGMIADMWKADTQQYAVAFVVFSSVGGSIIGPIIGGFTETYLSWQWSIWIQLIFGGFVQILHMCFVPETRSTIMLDNYAKKRRKEGQTNIYGPSELIPIADRFSAKEILATWIRPFKMFLTEPIVLVLSLLSGFSDALIFIFISSFGLVYKQWGFGSVDVGLAFIAIGLGASATGGNGWARDFLAGVLTIPATPFFTNLSSDPSDALAYASTILACISFLLVVAVYIIYWKGPVLRQRSPFAQKISGAREDQNTTGRSSSPAFP
ncbi:major facilitator superfamily transporter [Diplocarpon rosae]|nr:major facilitator superfamily transporter [Diplocarpon rosae]